VEEILVRALPRAYQLDRLVDMTSRTPTSELRRRLVGVAAEQAGYFSHEQALAAGYADPNVGRNVAAGLWERAGRGVYRLAGWPYEPWEDYAYWSLWSDRRGVVSHQSAIAYWGIGLLQPIAGVDLTVPSGFHRTPQTGADGVPGGVVLHRGVVGAEDTRHERGFAVTSPVRTVVDLAGIVDGDHLARTIADGVRRKVLDLDTLRAAAFRAGGATWAAVEAAGEEVGAQLRVEVDHLELSVG
jgi:hypothetical protein